ncbi:MAG: ATP-binding protein [Clostridia bacterium]
MKELSLNILDIAQNSVVANAKLIEIEIKQKTKTNELFIGIYDDGKGMDEEKLKSVTDPFFTTRTTRKIGLGVPLFKMAAEMTGGKFEITSIVGVGTNVKAEFNTSHLDFMPLGDLTSTIVILITMNLHIEFIYRYIKDETEFVLDTREIKNLLDGVPLDTPDIVQWLKEYIDENTN